MDLRLKKCVFGVPSGKLLGFFVSQRGIEANPDKIKAIEQIEAPRQIKDVRQLTGCVATMSRFISKSVERALPFSKILKKTGPVEWTQEAEAALQDFKKYLSSAPVLVAPKPQEPLLLYLAATNQVVSVALVAQREVDEKTAAAAEPMADRSEPSQAGLDPGRTESPAGLGPGKPDASATGPAWPGEVMQRKKVVQHPVYFVSSLL